MDFRMFDSLAGLQPQVTDAEIEAFNRFCEICEDSDADGHDVPAAMMKRLEIIGLVRRVPGTSSHEITSYGDLVRDEAQGEFRSKQPSDSGYLNRSLLGKLSPVVGEDVVFAFSAFCDLCENGAASKSEDPPGMIGQLVRIGLIRSLGFGRYETTMFGTLVRDECLQVDKDLRRLRDREYRGAQ